MSEEKDIKTEPAETTTIKAPTKEEVSEIIEQLRPSLQMDGGDVHLVDVNDVGVVKVRLTGACNGCPMSTMTLKMGIEATLKRYLPGVATVISV